MVFKMQLYSGTHAPGQSAEPRTRRFMEVWLLSLFRAEMFPTCAS